MALFGSNSVARVTAAGEKSLGQLQNWFFDREKVLKAADKGTIKALSRFGAFVRRRAQTSMKRRKKGTPSQPGSPPFARSGEMRDLLFFSYDPRTRSVVVGPLGFKAKTGTPVPALHEFGGQVAGDGRVVWMTNKPGRNAKGQFVSKGKTRVVLNGTLTYPPRPFMRPALEAELPKFAEQFRGVIGG